MSNFISGANVLGRKIGVFVHAHNVIGGTGTARFTREVVSRLLLDANATLIASREAWSENLASVEPWRDAQKFLFKSDASTQQRSWFLWNRPSIDDWLPSIDSIYSPIESYVPTKKATSLVTLHDAAIFERNVHPRNFRRELQRIKWQFLHSRMAKKVDMFHTISNFSAERLVHYFPEIKDRINVVPNGVSDEFFVDSAADTATQFYKARKPNTVLVPGGLSHRKNAGIILDVIKKNDSLRSPVHFYVAGKIDREFSSNPLLASQHVSLLGYVTDERAIQLNREVSLVWFPSKYEGFGIPILEAMASATPVVASRCTAVPEVTEDAAVLLDPNDSDEHLEHIITLSASPSSLVDLGKRGLARANNFTWHRTAKGIIDILRVLN